MVVLAVLSPGHPHSSLPTFEPLFVLTDDGGDVAAAYGASPGEPLFCLIGKDGTIKQTEPSFPTPAALFESVDAMPMRRQEMRERDARS